MSKHARASMPTNPPIPPQVLARDKIIVVQGRALHVMGPGHRPLAHPPTLFYPPSVHPQHPNPFAWYALHVSPVQPPPLDQAVLISAQTS
jgi:hypothetical protein